MSEDTYHAVEDALRAHLADEYPDDFLTDWVLIAAAAAGDGCGAATQYTCLTSHSPIHTIEGLMHKGLRIITENNPVE